MPAIKAICPFCSMQDRFYLEEQRRETVATWGGKSPLRLEFDPASVRGLCGRGNFCRGLATHPDRRYRARIEREYASVENVAKDLSERLSALSGERIAILLDGALTLEETSKAIALANKLGTRLVAPIPAEDSAVAGFDNTTTFERIAAAKTNIVIGDAFTLSPTLTRLVQDAKARERRNAIVGIDTVSCRTGWFAHPELISPIGRTHELIGALADAIEGKPADDLPLEDLGIDAGDLDWAIGAIEGASSEGNIIVAPGWHFIDPFAVCAAAKRLAGAAGFGFMVLTLSTGSRGIYRLLANGGFDMAGTFRALLGGGLDGLLSIDCDPKDAFPTVIIPEVFGMTGQLPTASYENATHFLPSVYLFEKTGSLLGTEGDIIKLDEKIDGPGAMSAGEIIDLLYGGEAPVDDFHETLLGLAEPERPPFSGGKISQGNIIGIGRGDVMHHSDGRYTRTLDFVKLRGNENIDAAMLSPELARSLELVDGDRIEIKSDYGTADLSVKMAEWIDRDIVLLPMHYPESRRLFDWGNSQAAGPVSIRVEKA